MLGYLVWRDLGHSLPLAQLIFACPIHLSTKIESNVIVSPCFAPSNVTGRR